MSVALPTSQRLSGLMICGTPLSNAFMSWGLPAPVRSDGLPRREASWGLAGFTPGARPTVRLSDGAGVASPGAGPPALLGPFTCVPGAPDEPAPLCWAAALPLLLEPAAPVEPLAEPELLAPPELPPPDPPLWAKATALERTKIATDAPRRFMGVLHSLKNNGTPCL